MDSGTNVRFGELLSRMIKNAGMTQVGFYTQLDIKKPYFYDILGGKTNPPPPDKQFAIIEILKPNQETRTLFFELAAQERHEVPADIAKFLEDEKKRKEIRKKFDYEYLIKDCGGAYNG